MEKAGPPSYVSRQRESSLGFPARVSLFVVLVILVTRYYAAGLLPFSPTLDDSTTGDGGHVSWEQIKPSRSIEWHPCFDGHQCARLEVPLDWKNKSNARTATVAITKLPAKVPVTDERYGGPVFINPGGPGGSGVRLALTTGRHLQDIIDASKIPASLASNSSGLYFDIVGFDPRGVNNTTPGIACFPGGTQRQAFDIQKTALGLITDGGISFNAVWNQIQAVSGTCSRYTSQYGGDAVDVGRYTSTPQVVEDIVAMAEALGEWREKESQQLARYVGFRARDAHVQEQLQWHKGKEMIQYLGFSYGTILGATLATMHPDRVKRFILDGVADMDDYYAGTWLSNLQDTDTIMDTLYTECHAAGPHKCPIYSATGARGSEAIIEQVLGRLRSGPVTVIGTNSVAPDIVTYSDLMTLIRDALYKPYDLFPKVARAVYELSLQEPNGTTLAARKQEGHTPFCLTQKCERDGPWSRACRGEGGVRGGSEAAALIHCTDAPDWTGHSANFHRDKWAKLKRESRWLGDYWSEITMYCASLSIRPSFPFLPSTVGANNTAHPILLASNTRDPVTPLGNAHKIASRFNNSAVLEQADDGHCVLVRPSLCTAKVARKYFQTGELPHSGAKCPRLRGPFDEDGGNEEEAYVASLDVEDKVLYEAVRRMGDVPASGRWWLGV